MGPPMSLPLRFIDDADRTCPFALGGTERCVRRGHGSPPVELLPPVLAFAVTHASARATARSRSWPSGSSLCVGLRVCSIGQQALSATKTFRHDLS